MLLPPPMSLFSSSLSLSDSNPSSMSTALSGWLGSLLLNKKSAVFEYNNLHLVNNNFISFTLLAAHFLLFILEDTFAWIVEARAATVWD